MKADIYRNLHKQTMSVRSREKETYGRVLARSNNLLLRNVRFVVNERGRQRVIATKQKNVHAVLRSESTWVASNDGFQPASDWVRITYNPYKAGYFYIAGTGTPVASAKKVRIIDGKVWAKSPTRLSPVGDT